jgi:mono/diheme cytochrome c family protein
MRLFPATGSLAANVVLGAVIAAYSNVGTTAESAQRTAAPGVARVAAAAPASSAARDRSIERGRYLVQIAGCNDCHTAGYAERGGDVPVAQWLTGMPIGFQGPWGTSYPANLRLTVHSMSEDQWLAFSRAQRLPPMPWFALRDMNDEDVRALYRFIGSLGVAGERTPQAVAPGGRVTTPVIPFVPMAPEALARVSQTKR